VPKDVGAGAAFGAATTAAVTVTLDTPVTLGSAITRYFRDQQLTNGSTLAGHRKARRKQLRLEELEDRVLMTVSVFDWFNTHLWRIHRNLADI